MPPHVRDKDQLSRPMDAFNWTFFRGKKMTRLVKVEEPFGH